MTESIEIVVPGTPLYKAAQEYGWRKARADYERTGWQEWSGPVLENDPIRRGYELFMQSIVAIQRRVSA